MSHSPASSFIFDSRWDDLAAVDIAKADLAAWQESDPPPGSEFPHHLYIHTDHGPAVFMIPITEGMDDAIIRGLVPLAIEAFPEARSCALMGSSWITDLSTGHISTGVSLVAVGRSGREQAHASRDDGPMELMSEAFLPGQLPHVLRASLGAYDVPLGPALAQAAPVPLTYRFEHEADTAALERDLEALGEDGVLVDTIYLHPTGFAGVCLITEDADEVRELLVSHRGRPDREDIGSGVLRLHAAQYAEMLRPSVQPTIAATRKAWEQRLRSADHVR